MDVLIGDKRPGKRRGFDLMPRVSSNYRMSKIKENYNKLSLISLLQTYDCRRSRKQDNYLAQSPRTAFLNFLVINTLVSNLNPQTGIRRPVVPLTIQYLEFMKNENRQYILIFDMFLDYPMQQFRRYP